MPLILPSFQSDLHGYLGGIVRDLGGIAIEVGGVADHVHLLVRLKPTLAIADALREIKAGSSKWVNEEKMKLRKFGWQDGYAAFTVSESQALRVRTYIQRQEQHHRRIDFQQEVRDLLRRHNIEFDERYLWD
jgi:REP element-mobilizing transposase RayT